MRRNLMQVLGVVAVIAFSVGAPEGQAQTSWRSQSLRDQPTTGPNGAIAAAETFTVNARMGAESKAVREVAPGVYALAGWGIAISYAIDAPGGWIIVDTGDNTQAAAEMRAMLEETVGDRIKVAAILITHWHYANGIAAWLDEGTELWGHEHLDAIRAVESGLRGCEKTSKPARTAGAGITIAASNRPAASDRRCPTRPKRCCSTSKSRRCRSGPSRGRWQRGWPGC